MRRWWVGVLACGLALVPSVAWANAGTPLMWASCFHLLLGNAMLGLLEGMLLTRWFGGSSARAIGWLVVANYLSAWGGLWLMDAVALGADPTIVTLRAWCLVFLLLAFVVTLLIEWPLFWLALGRGPRRLGRSVQATLLIHGISYALLLAGYMLVSGTTLLTRLEVVAPQALVPQAGHVLYYLNPEGTAVYRRPLEVGAGSQRVAPVATAHVSDRLFTRPGVEGGHDLWVWLEADDRKPVPPQLVQAAVAGHAPIAPHAPGEPEREPTGTGLNFGRVPSLAEHTAWRWGAGAWALEGLWGVHEVTGERRRFALELPLVQWRVRNAVQLADGLLLFQLGRDQIVLLDPDTHRITLLARGRGPVVVRP